VHEGRGYGGLSPLFFEKLELILMKEWELVIRKINKEILKLIF